MSEIIVIQSGDTVNAYMPALVSADSKIVRSDEFTIATEKNVEIKSKFDPSIDLNNIASWGTDNMYPTNMLNKAQRSGLFSRNAMSIGSMLYGGGLEYGYVDIVDGKKIFTPTFKDEIEQFIEESDLSNWLQEQCNDMSNFLNCFSLIHLNVKSTTNNTDVVMKISNLEAEFSRITKTEKGKSKYLFYSPSFADDGRYDEKNGAKYHLCNSMNKEEVLKDLGKERVFAFRKKFPLSPGYYYAVPPFSCLFDKDSWLDVAVATPKILNAINRNMTLIKYHVEYSYEYWKFLYDEWDKKTDSQKRELIDNEIKRMNQFLTGIENAGKTFVTFNAIDPQTKKEIPGCKITPLKNVIEKDAYLPNNTAANAEIVYYQGLDPSIIGMETPGGKLGAGSGSDKRVGWNVQTLMIKPIEDCVLSPLNFISIFNDWKENGKRIVWRIKREQIVTLDNNKETTEANGTV